MRQTAISTNTLSRPSGTSSSHRHSTDHRLHTTGVGLTVLMVVVLTLVACSAQSGPQTGGAPPVQHTQAAPVPGIYISSMKDLSDDYQISRLDTNSHQVLWSYNVGGLTSSIVIEGNTMYVSASGGPGWQDNSVYAFDAANGALRWQSVVSHGNAGSLTTPTVSSDGVYVLSKDGIVYALRRTTGKALWSYNTKMLYNPGNIIVADGSVYATMRTGLFAIEANSGKLAWSQQTDPTQILTSPQVVDGAVYFSSYSVSRQQTKQVGAVYSYNAKSGKQNWRHAMDSLVLSSPTVVDGIVYVGSYDTNLYALKAADGSTLWHYTTGGQIFDAPLVSNGVVYVAAKGNASEITGQPSTIKPALFAINAATGTKRWSQQLDISLQTLQEGRIYGGVFPRAVYVLKDTDGSIIWHQQYGPDLIDKTGGHSGAAPQITVVP